MKSTTSPALPQSYRVEAGALSLVYLLAGVALTTLAVSSFIASMPFGLVATFLLTLGLVVLHPASALTIILTSFALQNVIIATYSGLVSNDEVFDSLRGANFAILMTLYGAFILASFRRTAMTSHIRVWLLLSFAVLGVVCFYTALGAVSGLPRDAIVYFRNTISPLACFHVALVATSLYKIDLRRPLTWLTILLVSYGYLELFFAFDFLGLFGGDLYIERAMRRQFDTGVWEKALQQTGYVYLGLHDAMTANFFNTPYLAGLLPKVFRIGGPNFHPISFAYLLSITSTYFVLRNKWGLPLLAFPLMLIIGSKGAMILFLLALCVQIGLGVFPARIVLVLLMMAAFSWIGLAIAIGYPGGDYHVLGFVSGLREFASNPFGHGIGLGGNLSSTTEHVDFDVAQAEGFTSVPIESAVGVMLYQMGIGSFVFFGFLFVLACTCWRLFRTMHNRGFLFGCVGIIVISANAVLQEEAFYSPLALGLCLLITGHTLGAHLREQLQPNRVDAKPYVEKG